ncbi:MAG: 50S ribosomal protein L5 [Candidatus Nomurabacteria bacterium]|jgi:large subunit ribosomal protein L5|nr:50S ribosomal protein L5 [Candidatus Nomurabacteria bacterium]
MATKTTATQPRLKALYDSKIVPELEKELGVANVNQVPKLTKIVVSSGVGKKKDDKHYHETVVNTVTKTTGQQPIDRLAKRSVATFKIRKGMGAPIGVMVTLRGAKMYEFLDRLVNVALPRVRDFHGVPEKSFDKSGNYNLGVKEQSIFAELSFEDTQVLHGLEVTFVIKNGSAEGSKLLLSKFGMPFERKGDK